MVTTLLSLPSCNTISRLFAGSTVNQPKPFVQKVPGDAATPDTTVNGWRAFRSTPTEILWLPPLVQPAPGKVKVKVKNSHNTRNSQKKSNNTETKQKNSENTKARGEGIIGDANAPIQAKKQAVVGDGNTVKQQEQSLWWVWCLLTLAMLYLYWRWLGR